MSTNEIDFKLTTDLSLELNGRGDAATVTGMLLEQQDLVVRLLNEGVPIRGQRANPNLLREFEADIEDAMDESGYFDPPYYVETFADEDDLVRAEIDVGDEQFYIPP